nr:TolC family protein [uncultured Lacibacter sp.]
MKTKQQSQTKRPVLQGMKSNLFLLLFFLPVLAGAQEAKTLTLKEALQYALQANRDARKAKLDIENGQYQVDEVRARALPQVSGSASTTYNPILMLSAVPGELAGRPGETFLVAFGQKWNAGASVSVNQTIFDNSVFVGLKAAKTTAEFYRINAQLTEEQIMEQVATTYYQVLVQRQQLTVIDSTLKNMLTTKNVLQSLLDNGLAKKIDLDRIIVNISNMQSRRQQLLNGVALLENQLKFYMGMPINTPIIVPDIDLNSIRPQAVAKADSIDVNGRTEMQVLRKQEQLLNYQKTSIKGANLPTVSIGGNYSYNALGNKFPLFKGSSQGVNWFDVSSISLNIKVPIFNGGATKSKVKQADVAIRKLNEDINYTKLALNLSFENAKTKINNSIITLNTQKENVRLAEEVYFNTMNNYNNGLATLTDLLNAENSLTEAQNNYSAALLDYKVSEIQLLKAQGNLQSLLN